MSKKFKNNDGKKSKDFSAEGLLDTDEEDLSETSTMDLTQMQDDLTKIDELEGRLYTLKKDNPDIDTMPETSWEVMELVKIFDELCQRKTAWIIENAGVLDLELTDDDFDKLQEFLDGNFDDVELLDKLFGEARKAKDIMLQKQIEITVTPSEDDDTSRTRRGPH